MPIKRFLLRALLWLPVCFAAWYYSSILFVAPMARALDLLSTNLLPQLVSAVEAFGNRLQVVLTLEAQDKSTGLSRTGDMLFEIDPLIYGFCIPLYTVLVLASRTSDARRLAAWLMGVAILFLVQILCIQAEILKVVAIDLAAETQPLLGLPNWGFEAIALGYQLAYLILPGVTPIALWLFQFRDVVMDMAAGAEAAVP
jgi:hypothetical protein